MPNKALKSGLLGKKGGGSFKFFEVFKKFSLSARIACTRRKVQRCNRNTYIKVDLGVEYLRVSIRRNFEFTAK